jgi:hypothetical protein
MFVSSNGQVKTRGSTERPAVLAHFLQGSLVVRWVDDDADPGVVLGGRTQHGGAADIDVLDGINQ